MILIEAVPWKELKLVCEFTENETIALYLIVSSKYTSKKNVDVRVNIMFLINFSNIDFIFKKCRLYICVCACKY